jgi:hypothetical protein
VVSTLEDILGTEGSLVFWNIVAEFTEQRHGGDARVRQLCSIKTKFFNFYYCIFFTLIFPLFLIFPSPGAGQVSPVLDPGSPGPAPVHRCAIRRFNPVFSAVGLFRSHPALLGRV